MPARPLLILPTPERVTPPKGTGGGGNVRFPTKQRQIATFGPTFERLREALQRPAGALQLRDDPDSLSPDRVIVFEMGGAVPDFFKAAARIQGLELMAEYEADFAPDENFAVKDTRVGRVGQDRLDKVVNGRFYLTMPDTEALRQLLSLWDRWERNLPFDTGFAPFAHLFEQLHALRPWGPLDRIPDDTVQFWLEETARNPDRPVRTEVELWFYSRLDRRRQVSTNFSSLINAVGGTIVHEAIIPEIAYHGALIDIPAREIPGLTERRADIALVLADDVMFLRPQSLLISPSDAEPSEDASLLERAPFPIDGQPIAALLDGVPVQAHTLLTNRLLLDDPDDLQSRAVVSRRIHGTAMASLILHGDLNAAESPLGRPLYTRPLMLAPRDGIEQTDDNRLLIDTIYRAILRIKGSEGEEAAAPTVFLINLSMGDVRRPFTRLVSPLARLLDFLSERYGILFLVSAGNVSAPLTIPDFADWLAFENASPDLREKAVLTALNAAKYERSILSPAESLNALTIGAQHHDRVSPRSRAANAVDPFGDHMLPNVSSGLGLGHRRAVKPEIYFPGGREYVRLKRTGGGLEIAVGSPQRLYGLGAAAPDPTGQGRPDYVALSDGTSSATALATRAAHRIFDALMDRNGGSLFAADMDPEFYAVVVKSLLVHSARWNGNADLLKNICGPMDRRQHVERSENACRFIGFGIPNLNKAFECDINRATLVGYAALPPDHAHSYRIPLPGCLERVTDPRSLTVTIAWFSPIKPNRQSYRSVRLEAAPLHEPLEVLGVERLKLQPSDATVKRGTIFHEHFHGSKAVPFIDDGHLGLRVWCKEDAGGVENDVRYGIAITIEAEAALPIYDEIQQRLRVAPRPRQ
jgi:hypothetical protein